MPPQNDSRLSWLARQVADENPEVDAMLAAESVESFGVFGVIVSAIGVVANGAFC